ncbi:AMP-binding protein [Kordiimonas sp. SCSIO 12610]|uniref:AMP-binding protein n=1 Tax=Kordiimonas sp. SCSIO 12610 TaxID=2829597 RepID=UPI00210AA8FC|nr:AMP-binding protein [Kordiimonas sp. SCSIO 12610]UTW54641.1 AMP-binding protein [Kordiimonas sp. SCSIO 12610]
MGQLSYVSGVSDQPLRYQTIGDALAHAADCFGDKEALVFPEQDVRLSYADLNIAAERMAAGFLALGFKKGDRVGIWSPNRYEWALTQYATAKVGIILVNVNPAYRISELEYALNKVECKGIVTARVFKTSNYLEMINRLAPELAESEKGQLRAKKLPHLSHVIVMGEGDVPGCYGFDEISTLESEADHQLLSDIAATLEADDPINIQFTSGTTGSPKGATLTHHNILNNGYFVGARQNFSASDRLAIPVPLYHCFGMVMGVLGCLMHGATAVFPGVGFDPVLTLKAVQEEKCTALYGVPTMFVAMLETPEFESFDLSTLRTGCMAGSPCPVEIMKRVIADMNMAEVTIAYGMTETSPVSLQSMSDDVLEKRVSTVGQIHPHVEVKLVDEFGQTVQRGTQGELLTRGYSVMLGYWNDSERTSDSIDKNGWMHTGDLAVMDDEGYVNITGRAKDMIIRGGENIYPREIEEFLYTHPSIQDVQCFGVPDKKFGEVVSVWVKLKPEQTLDEAGLKNFCKDQIAHYKVPTYVRFVDEFPMTVTGKMQKFVMRDKMVEDLNITEQKTA